MNCSGIIRKVDELGRIVIPVEVRRILNIKEGEIIEFNIDNENIILKKKSPVESYINLICEVGNNIDLNSDSDYMITDREKIITSSNNIFVNKKLNNELINLLNNHEELSKLDNIEIDGVRINSTAYVFPYYYENDIAGFLIFYNIYNVDNYKKLAKFICNYLRNKISLT